MVYRLHICDKSDDRSSWNLLYPRIHGELLRTFMCIIDAEARKTCTKVLHETWQ